MVEHELQIIDEISAESLSAEADALKLDDWRIVQILCVSRPDGYELTYSFGGGYAMRSLRVSIGLKDPVPSITPYFPAAFLYENEIRDLFGVRIERIDPDWNGTLLGGAEAKPFAKVAVALTSSEKPPSAIRATGLGAAGNGAEGSGS